MDILQYSVIIIKQKHKSSFLFVNHSIDAFIIDTIIIDDCNKLCKYMHKAMNNMIASVLLFREPIEFN